MHILCNLSKRKKEETKEKHRSKQKHKLYMVMYKQVSTGT